MQIDTNKASNPPKTWHAPVVDEVSIPDGTNSGGDGDTTTYGLGDGDGTLS